MFGTIIHFAEPSTFPSIWDGLWWSVVTTFTVGYGDYVPESPVGRFFAFLLILLGTGLGSYYMISFSAQTFRNQDADFKGILSFNKKGHIVIVGWNERVKNVIKHLHKSLPNCKIVLIDESLELLPPELEKIHFVRGSGASDYILQKANLKFAHTVLITADQNKNEHDADMQTILTILATKGVNPSINCIAEILTKNQVTNAYRAGANEVIETHLLTSFIMSGSILNKGYSDVFIKLANQLESSTIQIIVIEDSMVGVTFSDILMNELKKDHIVIGVLRGMKSIIHPPNNFKIEENDLLIVLN